MGKKRNIADAGTVAAGTVAAGRVTGAHGIRGEVKVKPYPGFEDFPWRAIIVERPGGPRAFKVVCARRHKGGFIFEMEGLDTRDDALSLAGSEFHVKREELPDLPEGEYYCADLMGMEVFDEDDKFIGRVTDVIATGGNDVIEVNGPFGEVLIPAIEGSIIEVDGVGARIVVRLLEGLLPE
jgi:16S rRNA processing protein RimM